MGHSSPRAALIQQQATREPDEASPTALAARVAVVQIGSTWTNVLARSRVDPPVQR